MKNLFIRQLIGFCFFLWGSSAFAQTVSVPSSSTTGNYNVTIYYVSGPLSTIDLQIAYSSSGPWANVGSYSNTTQNIPQSQTVNRTYWYRTRGRGTNPYGGGEMVTGWGTPDSIVVNIPDPVPTQVGYVGRTPSTTTDGNFEVSWGTATYAERYEWREKLNSGSWSGYTNNGTSRTLSRYKTQQGSWYYEVRACNTSGCGSPKQSPSAIVDFPTPPKVGTLSLGNSEGTYDTNGTISVSWSGVSNASSYQFRYGKTGTTKSTVSNVTSGYSRSGLSDGVWEFEVRACNLVSECGAWSNKASKEVRLIPGVPPGFSVSENPSNDGTYSINWSAASGVVNTYEWREKIGSGGWSGVTSQSSSNRSKSFSKTAQNTYYYQVRACRSGGICSGFASQKSTVVDFPTPAKVGTLTLGNSEGTYDTNGSISVSWSGVSYASSYKLRYGKTGSTKTTVNNVSSGHTRSSLTDGVWEFEVQACNTANECGSWSNKVSKEVRLPPGVPASFSISETQSYDGTFSISWSQPSGVVNSYEWREKIGSGSWSGANSQSGTSKSFTKNSDGSYSYQVRACRSGGICSSYSSTKTVTVEKNIVPPLNASVTTSTNGNYSLNWGSAKINGVDANTEIHYWVYEDGTPIPVYTKSSTGTTNEYIYPLSRTKATQGTWTYYTRACINTSFYSPGTQPNPGTGTCLNGPTVNVTVDFPPPPKVGNLSLGNSEGTYDTNGVISVSWSAVSGATSYKLRYGLSGQSKTTISNVNSGYTPPTLSQGTWEFEVVGCNQFNECENWSNVASKSVLFIPGIPSGLSVQPEEPKIQSDITLTSSVVSGADSYQWQYTTVNGAWPSATSSTSNSKNIGALDEDEYRFRAKACNAAGCSNYSSEFTFKVRSDAVVRYRYDELGRLRVVEDSINGDKNYNYDPAGNRTTVTEDE